MRPSGRGGPSRWTPETLPVAPVQYRYALETFRCPYDSFPYINLYLRTILELLVMSGISSGTVRNLIRDSEQHSVTTYYSHYNSSVTEP